MGSRLAHSTSIVWETFGAAALRRFHIRISLEERLQARRRLRKVRGRGHVRAAPLASGMMRRLVLLLRERPTTDEAHA